MRSSRSRKGPVFLILAPLAMLPLEAIASDRIRNSVRCSRSSSCIGFPRKPHATFRADALSAYHWRSRNSSFVSGSCRYSHLPAAVRRRHSRPVCRERPPSISSNDRHSGGSISCQKAWDERISSRFSGRSRRSSARRLTAPVPWLARGRIVWPVWLRYLASLIIIACNPRSVELPGQGHESRRRCECGGHLDRHQSNDDERFCKRRSGSVGAAHMAGPSVAVVQAKRVWIPYRDGPISVHEAAADKPDRGATAKSRRRRCVPAAQGSQAASAMGAGS